jgi:hypothetical protein
MFTTRSAGATFSPRCSGIAVQKIPFSIFNIAVYLYLFSSVAALLDQAESWPRGPFALAVAIVAGLVFLAVLATRIFPAGQWAKAARAASSAARSSVSSAPGAVGVACRSPAAIWRGWRSSPSLRCAAAFRHLPQRGVGHRVEL